MKRLLRSVGFAVRTADVRTNRKHASRAGFVVAALVAIFVCSTFSVALIRMRGTAPNAATSMRQDSDRLIEMIQLQKARRGHTATLLEDSRILVIGGANEFRAVPETEVFDPVSRSFALGTKSLEPRADHSAILLADGRVLIAAGRNGNQHLNSTEIYDPVRNTFSRGPSLSRPRAGHTGTVLSDGRYLLVGGDEEGTAELFDPATQSFALLSSHQVTARSFHAAALLQSGKVLIAGGLGYDGNPLSTAEIFDPTSLSFSPASSEMHAARTNPTLRVLPDGKVQVIGGDDGSTMEMFNPEGEYFTACAHLVTGPESVGRLLRSPGRTALIHPAKGSNGGLQSAISELQDEVSATIDQVTDRIGYSLTVLQGFNNALVAGGLTGTATVTASAVVLADSGVATVTTDKTDYVPGERVTITGTGWKPGETVELLLQVDPKTSPDTTLTPSVADNNGNFVNNTFIIRETDAGVTLTLTATGKESGRIAQTNFTDITVQTLKVIKTVDWQGSAPDQNQSFQICVQGPSYSTPNCKIIGYQGGTLTWNPALPGQYTVTETNPGSSWTVVGSPTLVTVNANQTVNVPVTNTMKIGSLQVTKTVDWQGSAPDPSQNFQICIQGPSYSTSNCKTIGYQGGTLTWNNLIPGQYAVTETSPGASWTVTGTPANVAVNPGAQGTAAVTNTLVGAPKLTLNKSASPTTYNAVSQTISYSYVLTNSGNVTLAGPFAVSDDKASVTCPATPASLAPGTSLTCSATYWITQADLDSGSVTNHAAASAMFGNNIIASGPAQATITAIAAPKLTLSISANPTTYSTAGQMINYSYLLMNSGNVTLSSPFIVTDDKVAVTCPATATTLEPGASITCSATHSITQADLDYGTATNTATALASFGTTPITANTAGITVNANQDPHLSLTKTASPATYDEANDKISYSYELLNSGNVTLGGPFTIYDNKATVTCPAPPTGTLAPGGSISCSATYSITQADLDSGAVTNMATGHARFGNIAVDSNPAQATVNAILKPALSLATSANPTTYDAANQTITYSYLLTNSGNVTLAGSFAVTDDKQGIINCGSGPLAPGGTISCLSTHLTTATDLLAGSITNTAVVATTYGGNRITSNQAAVTVSSTVPPVSVACAASTGQVSVTYSSSLEASGGLSPYRFSFIGNLPPGLNLNPVTGAITGTPSSTGTFSYTAQAVDVRGTAAGTGTSSCSIIVAPPPPPPVTLTCASSFGKVGVAYSSSLAATGGVPPYAFSIVVGSLPPGLALNASTGAITGMPVLAGTFNYTAKVVDSTGSAAGSTTSSCSITILPSPVTLSVAANFAPMGMAYSSSLMATGGVPPYTFSIIGNLPPGLALNPSTGAITGTPPTAGSSSFSAKVVDSTGSAAGTAVSDCGTMYVYQESQFVIWGGNPPIPSGQPANVNIGQDYPFWGDQWAKQIQGGNWDANASFKGYANQVDRILKTWTTRPGNSSGPPNSVASYISVVVATQATKKGTDIFGNIAEVAILRVDDPSVYGPDPGHSGSGVLVAIVH